MLGPSSGQHEVFDTCGKPLVEAALNGQRACLFACALHAALQPQLEVLEQSIV